jgi:hypothetical protein
MQGAAAGHAVTCPSITSDELVRCWVAEDLLSPRTTITGTRQMATGRNYRYALEAGKVLIQALQKYSLLPNQLSNTSSREEVSSGWSDAVTGVSVLAMGVPRLKEEELFYHDKIGRLRWLSFMNGDGRHVSWDWRENWGEHFKNGNAAALTSGRNKKIGRILFCSLLPSREQRSHHKSIRHFVFPIRSVHQPPFSPSLFLISPASRRLPHPLCPPTSILSLTFPHLSRKQARPHLSPFPLVAARSGARQLPWSSRWGLGAELAAHSSCGGVRSSRSGAVGRVAPAAEPAVACSSRSGVRLPRR